MELNIRKTPHPLETMQRSVISPSRQQQAVPVQVMGVHMHIDSQYHEYLLMYVKQLPNQGQLQRPKRKYGWDMPQADAVIRVNAESHDERAQILKLVQRGERKLPTASFLPLVDRTIGVVQDDADNHIRSICPMPQVEDSWERR